MINPSEIINRLKVCRGLTNDEFEQTMTDAAACIQELNSKFNRDLTYYPENDTFYFFNGERAWLGRMEEIFGPPKVKWIEILRPKED